MSTTPLMGASLISPLEGTNFGAVEEGVSGVLVLGTTKIVLGEDSITINSREEGKGKKRGCCAGLLSFGGMLLEFLCRFLRIRLTVCFQPASGPALTSVTIPLYNVLVATTEQGELVIAHAKPAGKEKVVPETLNFKYEGWQATQVSAWAKNVTSLAYGEAQPFKRLKVLINPFGGKGNAATLWEQHCKPIFVAARCPIDAHTTSFQGEAINIAEELDIEAFDAVVCASGDGIPHEVFNGLGKRPDARIALEKIALAQLPCGSGNAMCHNLTGTPSPSLAALAIVKGIVKPMDLVSLTQDGERRLSFLSQSFGIVAEADLGTENLRWMGGDLRFLWGMLSSIGRQAVYPCDLAVLTAIEGKDNIRDHYQLNHSESTLKNPISPKDKSAQSPSLLSPSITSTAVTTASSSSSSPSKPTDTGLPPLKYGTSTDPLPSDWPLVHHPTMGNFYAGKMSWVSLEAKFFPFSLPHEGLFDLICIDGRIPRWDAIKTLLAAATGTHFHMDHVEYRKVLAYRITPIVEGGDPKGGEGYISVDGERVPFRPFQAEVHEGLGRVLGKKGNSWENSGCEAKK